MTAEYEYRAAEYLQLVARVLIEQIPLGGYPPLRVGNRADNCAVLLNLVLLSELKYLRLCFVSEHGNTPPRMCSWACFSKAAAAETVIRTFILSVFAA